MPRNNDYFRKSQDVALHHLEIPEFCADIAVMHKNTFYYNNKAYS